MGIDPTHRVTVDAATLTDDQRDGLACVTCRTSFAPGTRSIPVAVVDGDQVFACVGCVPPCADCGTVQYEYLPDDNDTARMDCRRGHAFPTAEPFTDAGRQADAEQGSVPTPDEDDEQAARVASLPARLLAQVDGNADMSRRFTDQGETDLARAFADIALAFRMVADALESGEDAGPALDRAETACERARAVLAAVRAR